MTKSQSILVLETQCSGGPQESWSDDLGPNAFAWQQLQDTASLVCDLVLLPEIPNNEDFVDLAKATSFRERRKASLGQQTTKLDALQLYPCGTDNVLLFEDLPFRSNILASITNCYFQDQLFPIDAVPSHFVLKFEPSQDQVLYSMGSEKEAVDSALAQVVVQFDVSTAQRMFQEQLLKEQEIVEHSIEKKEGLHQNSARKKSAESLNNDSLQSSPNSPPFVPFLLEPRRRRRPFWNNGTSFEALPFNMTSVIQQWNAAPKVVPKAVPMLITNSTPEHANSMCSLVMLEDFSNQSKKVPTLLQSSSAHAVESNNRSQKVMVVLPTLVENKSAAFAALGSPPNESSSPSPLLNYSFTDKSCNNSMPTGGKRGPVQKNPHQMRTRRAPTSIATKQLKRSEQELLLIQELQEVAQQEDEMINRILMGMVGLGIVLVVAFLWVLRRIVHKRMVLRQQQRQEENEAQKSKSPSVAAGQPDIHHPLFAAAEKQTSSSPNRAKTELSNSKKKKFCGAHDRSRSSLLLNRSKNKATALLMPGVLPQSETRGITSIKATFNDSTNAQTSTVNITPNVATKRASTPGGASFMHQLQAARLQKATSNTKQSSVKPKAQPMPSSRRNLSDLARAWKEAMPADSNSNPSKGEPRATTSSSPLQLQPSEAGPNEVELSPCSRLAKQWEETKSLRRSKMKGTKSNLLVPPLPELFPDHDKKTKADANTATATPANPSQIPSLSDLSSPPQAKEEERTPKKKSLYIPPFNSSLTPEKPKEKNPAPSPASTTVSDGSFTDDYW